MRRSNLLSTRGWLRIRACYHEARRLIRLSAIAGLYLRVGILSFGAAASEVIARQIVENKRWLTWEEYGRLISLSTLVPGPFHVNLVIATGYSLGGIGGGFVSALAFVLPGFILAVAAALILDRLPVLAWLSAHSGVTTGIVAGVAGLLLSIIVKLGQRSLPDRRYWLLVFIIAALLSYFRFPFALAILCGGMMVLVYRAARAVS